LIETFKKLSPDDREIILQKAMKEKALFVFKFGAKTIKAKMLNLKRANYIACVCPSEIHTLRTRQDVVVIMVLEGERYFFQSFVFVDEEQLLFKRKVDFYHLVRRKNKRLKIPHAMPASLMIKRLNGNLSFLKAVLADFSDTGCKLSLNTEFPKIDIGDELTGNLKIGDRRAVEITGVVKHHVRSAEGARRQTFGLNFQFPNGHATTMVKSLFLDLQRELFVEFYGKK
jgi:mannuronan synthase